MPRNWSRVQLSGDMNKILHDWNRNTETREGTNFKTGGSKHTPKHSRNRAFAQRYYVYISMVRCLYNLLSVLDTLLWDHARLNCNIATRRQIHITTVHDSNQNKICKKNTFAQNVKKCFYITCQQLNYSNNNDPNTLLAVTKSSSSHESTLHSRKATTLSY